MNEHARADLGATSRRRWVRATIGLSALAVCLGGAIRLGWRHGRPPASSVHNADQPAVSPENFEPVVVAEARGQVDSREPRDSNPSPTAWAPIHSPEARELVDYLAASASTDRRTHVGIFSDKSCCDEPEPLARILDAIPECRWELVTPLQVHAARLDRFDVLIFPGGRGHRQAAALGDKGRRVVRDFVRAGGGFVGICAGGFLATAQYDWSLGLVNTQTLHGDRVIPGLGKKSMADRGPGTVKIELTEAGRAVFGEIQQPFEVSFSGGPIYLGPMRDDLPPSIPLAYYRTELVNYEPQRGTMINTPAIFAARFGAGRVVAISPHPESTRGLEFLVKRSVLATARRPAYHASPPAKKATSSETSRKG